MNLDPSQVALVELVDGRRSISDIAALAQAADDHSAQNQAAFEKRVQKQFQVFWQLDFMAMALAGDR